MSIKYSFYRIRNFLETCYFYFWKDTTSYWFNDETNKYEKDGLKSKAKDTTEEWYNGIGTVISAMIQKVEFMHYKLKKYGIESPSYLFGVDFVKLATDNDKKKVAIKLLNEFIKDENKTCSMLAYFSDDKKEYSYFLEKGNENIKIVRQEKSSENIVTISTIELDAEKVFNVLKETNLVSPFSSDKIENALNGYLEYRTDVIKIMPWELKDYEADFRPSMVGNLWKLRRLLELRRELKKLNAIDDTDDKYYNIWKDAENKGEKLIESRELYKSDIHKAYMRVMEIMEKYHDTLWD